MTTKNVVFIDSRVADHQTLVAGLGADTAWVLLDAEQDGVLQMQAALAGYKGLDSIQIVSHGSTGTLYLGTTVLDAGNLSSYQVALQTIGQSLSATGDLLLYGCNIGADATGRAFIAQLATVTGADVAASKDLTGAASQGGNWTLEVANGQIEAQTLGVDGALAGWNHVLPVISQPSSPSFAAKVDYATGFGPYSVISADVNGDGKADLITANSSSNTVSVLTNSGNGSFAAKVDYATGASPISVTSADVNGDGKADLIVANYYSNTVSVLTNNGSGAFTAKINYMTGSNPYSVSSADVNGDGKADLIVANYYSNSVSVLTNNGNGTFATKVDYDTGSYSYPASVTSADVNGDGKVDLIVANSDRDTVSVLTNNGNGSFAASVDYATGSNPYSVTSADVNGDGKADLITANSNSNTVSVLTNNGNGSFAASVDYATGWYPYSVTSADVNGDGKVDLVVINSNDKTVSVLTNNGNGSFAAKVDYATGSVPYSVTSADVNGDGKADLIVANAGNSTVSVLTNTNTAITPINGTPNNDPALMGTASDDEIYGLAGNDTIDGAGGNDTMFGGLGNDLFRVRQTGDIVTENLNEGTDIAYSYLSAYTLTTNVENGFIAATGAANLTGNSLNNILYASLGNNVLTGGGGSDTVSYLYGVMGTTGVTVSLASAASQPTVGSGSDTLSGIVNLTGSNYADRLTGSILANVLNGGAGSDVLDGGWGNDTYYLDSAGDQVIESNSVTAIGGTDTVVISGTITNYTLGSNIENGRIAGTGAVNLMGNTLNNYIFAGAGNNVINGNGGADTLSYLYGVTGTTGVTVSLAEGGAQATVGSGSDTLSGIRNLTGSAYADRLTGNVLANVLDGGAGADVLTGNDGSDTYFVRDAGDVVIETNIASGTGGTDLVYSYLSAYTLTDNVENGRIVSTAAANLTGNGLNNVLYASVGNNVLNGGSGIDTVSYLYGQTGTIGVIVSLAFTTTQATTASGTDTLIGIENLIGSSYADLLVGNGSANILDGGAGIDELAGKDGNDTYYISDIGDIVTETTADITIGGRDIVNSKLAAYTLTANVENGKILATGAANLTGNALDNLLSGNTSDNILTGNNGNDNLVGGQGNDKLFGGAGTDTAIFSGQSADYEFGYANYQFTITDKNLLDGNDGVDVINGIENIQFADKTITFNSKDQNISQIFGSKGYFSTFAELSKAAYHLSQGEGVTTIASFSDKSNFVKPYADDAWVRTHQDWNILTAENLSVRDSGTKTVVNVQFDAINTFNLSWRYESDGIYHGNNSAAFAARCGDAIVISFRGTNDNDVMPAGTTPDMDDWLRMSDHYSKLEPFITAVDSYIAKENITKVYVTGHSLGGGMALGYMDKHDVGEKITANGSTVSYEAVTFAAPKYPLVLPYTDNRILAIEVDGDPVPDVGTGFNTGNVIGVNVEGLVHQVSGTDYGTTDFHSMDLYQAAANTMDKELPSTATVSGNIVHGFDKTLFSSLYGLEVSLNGTEVYPTDAESYSWKTELAPKFSLGEGRDTISESASFGFTDYFIGGKDNDLLIANKVSSYLYGGDGLDTVSYQTATAGVTANLSITTAQNTAESGMDLLSSIENLTGSAYADKLTGNGLSNILRGGAGKDTLTGNAGNDIFDFNAISEMGLTSTTWDVITDFVRGQDKIDLSTIDVLPLTTAFNDAFTSVIASTATFSAAGQLKFSGGLLYGNLDTDSAAEFIIQLTGVTALSTADFVL